MSVFVVRALPKMRARICKFTDDLEEESAKLGGVKFSPQKALTPQLMVCYVTGRHYALSQVRVS